MFGVGQVLTEVTFLIRTWALWGSTRPIAILLGAFFLATWIPCLVIEYFALKSFTVTHNTKGPGCVKAGGNVTLVRVQDATILIYWVVLLVLMMLKGGRLKKRLSAHGLYGLLFRDGLTYCGLLCSVITANMVTTAFAHEYLKLLTFFQHVLLSVLTNRLLFRLRQYNQRLIRSVQMASNILAPEETIAFEQPRHAIEIEMSQVMDVRWEEPQHALGAV